MEAIELIPAALLGIGLSASSGFRVFIPLLVVSLSQYFNWFELGADFQWLGSLPAVISLSVAALVEVAAYYIPIIDNALDTIATPLALIAGTILTTAVLPLDEEWLRWGLGIIIGGTSATAVQAGTSLTRLVSSNTTLGTANPIVSTTENVGATGGSILSLVIPVVMGILFLVFIIFILKRLYAFWKKRKFNNTFKYKQS